MILRLQHQRPDGEIDSYYLKPGRRYHIGRGSTCEVRVLDLKLSRKHCALEFTDNRWHAVDLMSTNGCTLNGVQIVGNAPLSAGSIIEAGQTRLTVADILDPTQDEAPAVVQSSEPTKPAKGDTDAIHYDHIETTAPEIDQQHLEQESLPEGPNNASGKNDANRDSRTDSEPEPNSDALNKTDALMPNRKAGSSPIPPIVSIKKPSDKAVEPRRPTAVFRADGLSPDMDHDNLGTRVHGSEAPAASVPPPKPTLPTNDVSTAAPGTDSQERTFYITLLGRRVGPLTRAAARELKSRELKGTLTTSDLEQYPLG
jgi:pSer/pThr/pTyr-binding forkhead associated (FHA) protein